MQTCLVFAQTEQPDTVISLGNVTVTGRSSREATSTAPVFNIDNKEMKRLGIADLSTALHRMPGLTLKDYGGAGGMKTVSIRGLGAGHTAVVYDGLVLGSTQSGDVDVSRYSVDNLSSIKLVIGDNDDIFMPARVLASAGSLSLSTPSLNPYAGKDSAKGTLQIKGGSFGLINPFFRVEKNTSDKFAIGVTGDYLYAENDYPFTLVNGNVVTRERRNNSRMNSWHGELNMALATGVRSTLKTKLYYYDNDRRLPGAVVYYNNVNKEQLHDRNFFGQATFRSVLPHNLSLLVNGRFNWSESLYHDENGKYPGGELNQNYWQRETYVSGALLWLPTTELSFDYSADYFFNNLNSNLESNVLPLRHSVLQSLTGRWKNKIMTVTARTIGSIYKNSARKGESARDYSHISPSVSVSVRPLGSEMFHLRAGYKNIFRMPTFNETYYEHIGETNLRPEFTDQLNFGTTWQIKDCGSVIEGLITADVYLNHVKDKIVAVPYNMFLWSMTNLEKVTAYGVDVTSSFDISLARAHSLLFAVNYSYQRSKPKINPDKQVAYTPRHSGGASVGYENPWVNVSLSATGVSDRYTTNDNIPATKIAGYIEVGLTAYRTFEMLGKKFELRGDVINLLNKQYEIVAHYPMPGRSWRVAIKFDF